jgi:hypothetical protein
MSSSTAWPKEKKEQQERVNTKFSNNLFGLGKGNYGADFFDEKR